MTTVISPSSASHGGADIPTATLAHPSTNSRRLPPPCWTTEEAAALIDAYRNKWYSLRRGNLRAIHWEEVAAVVGSLSGTNPSKTAVQCRHKMEKLRKRYRAEIQRSRGVTSWNLFQKMHSMEIGSEPHPHLPPSSTPSSSDDDDDNPNYIDNQKHPISSTHQPITKFRHKIPNSGDIPRFPGEGASKRSDQKSKPLIAAALESLVDNIIRTEETKMEMVIKMEEERMEIELNRTKMLLESQKRMILQAFGHGDSDTASKIIKKPRKDQ